MTTDVVLNIYLSLLADVCEVTKVPLGTPGDITYDWVLKEAPKLDKALLMYLEGTDSSEPAFPDWIKPLWDRFKSQSDIECLRGIRQLLLFCYKIEHEPNDDQLKESQTSFELVDEGVSVWDQVFPNLSQTPLLRTARQIVGRVIYRVNWREILPSHGPGAVFPSRLPWNKSEFLTIYPSIEQYYPYFEYFCGIPSFWDTARSHPKFDIAHSPITAKLVAVPKDSRGPRLICVHPSESIWIQQGCRDILEAAITSPSSPCYGKINFHDQSVNGKLALSSSLSRELVTLDLKEASDRISCNLVRFLFGEYAYNYISCSRAERIRLLDNRIITLNKWAPMGNALCFPVQSLIFYSIVHAGIRCRYGIDCTDIYVFGDDILFPSQYYDGALLALVKCGLVPNFSKTFRRGFFRESCGVDAYLGKDVTPLRLRRIDPSTCSGASSLCSLAKACELRKFTRTSALIYRLVSRHFPLYFTNNVDCQGICRYIDVTWDGLSHLEKRLVFDKNLQRWVTPTILSSSTVFGGSACSWWNIQDSLIRLARKSSPIGDGRGLEYAVPHRTRSKRGWTEAIMK
jgi:hypothetical protein